MRSLRFSVPCLVALFFTAAAGLSENFKTIGMEGDEQCVYTIYVRTGSIIKGGTDSKISLVLGDPSGRSVWVPNLESWGLMGAHHNYYERGSLDIFGGLGPCVGAPICRLNLTSDGSGSHHGWYCNYVEVSSTGPHIPCSQTTFYVQRWLATDFPPYKLTAVLDGCNERSRSVDPAKCGKKEKFIVGHTGKGSVAASKRTSLSSTIEA